MRIPKKPYLLFALFFIGLLSVAAFADSKTSPQSAPLPVQLFTAKKVFISNAGVTPYWSEQFKRWGYTPYDRFYAEMKNWGRFELVDAPADADLVFEIKFSAPNPGLRILDARTHFVLWTLNLSVLSTKEKYFTKSMDDLVGDLKSLVEKAAPPAKP